MSLSEGDFQIPVNVLKKNTIKYVLKYMGTYKFYNFLADPGKARGCSTNTSVTDSFSHPLVPTALRRRHAQTVR